MIVFLEVMVTKMLLVFTVLGSFVVVMSDQVTLPPGYALQDYLCGGPLKSNTTVVLDDGEHLISTGPRCYISNQVDLYITIMGSSMKSATVHCQGEGRVFRFFSLLNLTMEGMTFINCGIELLSVENLYITNCTIRNSPNGGIFSIESKNTYTTSCVFENNNAYFSVLKFYRPTGNVIIANCTFLNNNFIGGGAVELYEPTSDILIANCAFHNNSANGASDSVVMFRRSSGNVIITNCTFKNNSANYCGGAVCLHRSEGNFNITNCKFLNNINIVIDYGSARDGSGALYVGTDYADITNCTFQNNIVINHYGGGGGGALYVGTDNADITNCTFQNNIVINHYGGGGGGAVYVLYNAGITTCTFQNNRADDGGAVYVYAGENIGITNCIFQSNIAKWNGGAVYVNGPTGDVTITKCTFQNNRADDGIGGAVWLHAVTANSITSCTFQNNSAIDGGSVMLDELTGEFTIKNCTFQNNRANFGGAVRISAHSIIIIDGATFANNTAVKGAAIYAIAYIQPNVYLFNKKVDIGHLLLHDVIVKNNHCPYDEYNDMKGGAIFFNGLIVDIFGNTITGCEFSSNSPQGAIQGENGYLQLHGNITFTNNTGVNGGGISLSNNAPLYFYDQCKVEFSRNVATGNGGAIYNDGKQKNSKQDLKGIPECVISFIYKCSVTRKTECFSITFIDNYAQQGGHAVYATAIYNCMELCDYTLYCERFQNLTSYFTLTPSPEDHSDIQVLSFPTYVHLCGCSDPNLCNVTSQHEGKVTTYPGRTVRLNVTSVDNRNNLSPSVVYTLIDMNGITSPNMALGPTQKAQWIGTVCGSIEYQIYGPEMTSLKLFLFNYLGNVPIVIEVKLLPCEPGFTIMSNSSTGAMQCGCSLFFTSYGVVCDASDGTVTRRNNWIGIYNDTLPALASFCPLDYCNSTTCKLSLARPGDLCNGGRTGILCGHCYGNHSVIFGSSQCQVCTDMWLITLVMFAVLGVLLVTALFFLNLTVTQGTLYGLIFYANIIQVNNSIFFSGSYLNPLQVIVSFVNLDLGLPLCFYDGMDDADKAGLQFVFPAYLLILTMTVIVLCHYCLQRSPATSSRSCLHRFPIIIGQRAVGVLCTLIYLSYSKLLRAIIDVITYSIVHLPSGDMYVWFYDGNVNYLHGKHIVLFAVAMVTCTLFLLPYTFALTFIPIIERYSEHNRLFNYLHKKVNQIKPMIDAHYAPYKGEWRWWLGARLWLLIVMYSLHPVYSSNNPSLLLSIQASIMILFTIAQAGIKPFGKSYQKTSKQNCLPNKLHNSLELFYLLNYIALVLSMSYILEQSTDHTQISVVIVCILVGLYVVVLMTTVLYHLIMAILKICDERCAEKINGLFEKKYAIMRPIELDESTNDTVAATVNYGLREQLL